jgi:hypothetical protein
VVGFIYSYNTGGDYAFLYSSSKTVNLNTLIPAGSGWNLTSAVAINDATTSLPSGTIVGYGTYNGSTHMFLAIDPPVRDAAPADGKPVAAAQAPVPNQPVSLPGRHGPSAPQAGTVTVNPRAVDTTFELLQVFDILLADQGDGLSQDPAIGPGAVKRQMR